MRVGNEGIQGGRESLAVFNTPPRHTATPIRGAEELSGYEDSDNLLAAKRFNETLQ
jgi:hypothetical protein